MWLIWIDDEIVCRTKSLRTAESLVEEYEEQGKLAWLEFEGDC